MALNFQGSILRRNFSPFSMLFVSFFQLLLGSFSNSVIYTVVSSILAAGTFRFEQFGGSEIAHRDFGEICRAADVNTSVKKYTAWSLSNLDFKDIIVCKCEEMYFRELT